MDDEKVSNQKFHKELNYGRAENHSLVNRASIHINPDEEGNCLQVTQSASKPCMACRLAVNFRPFGTVPQPTSLQP
jgi:hypothetical protein